MLRTLLVAVLQVLLQSYFLISNLSTNRQIGNNAPAKLVIDVFRIIDNV